MNECEITSPQDGETQVSLTQKEKRRIYAAAWRKANPDKVKAASDKHSAKPSVRERQRLYSSQRRKDPKIKEKIRIYQIAYLATPESKARRRLDKATRRLDPEFREKTRLAGAKYRAKPGIREKDRLRDAKYNADPLFKKRKKDYEAKPENKERRRLRDAKLKETPEGRAKINAKASKRRAIKKGATIGDTKAITAWMKSWRHLKRVTCRWCNTKIKPKDAHVDHIIPLKLLGPHSIENLCVACFKCNNTKRAKSPELWNAMIDAPILML